MKQLKDNWAILLFVALIVFGNSFVKRYTETIDTSDRERYQIERDSLLNLSYEAEKTILELNAHIKYLEYEIEKDRAAINGATPSELIDLTADFMRRIRQRDSLR